MQIDLLLASAEVRNNVLGAAGTLGPALDLSKVFKFNKITDTAYQVDYAIDLDGKRLRLALAQTVGSFDDMIELTSPSTYAEVKADIEANHLAAIPADAAALNALLEAKLVGAGIAADGANCTANDCSANPNTGTAGYLFSDDNGTATTAGEKVDYINALNAQGILVLEDISGLSTASTVVAAGTAINFDFKNANQIFNLKSGANNDVAIKIGALKNASYSADPVQSGKVFELGDLFELDATTSGKATALVSTGFVSVDVDTNTGSVVEDKDIVATGFDLYNRTSNQNIQLNKVNLTLAGDLGAFRADTAGNLLLKDNTPSGWKLSADKMSATAKAGEGVLQGVITKDAAASTINTAFDNLGKLYVAADNVVPVEAQNISVTATILGADQDTFEDFTHTLSELFIITRDGLKFDTILTGTTSSNTVHIRDVSGILPEVGGKIFVTVWEYDAHEAGENAERNVLAERKELAVKLPSNGAVTLSPATIAAQLGIEVAPARQARMLFEVETNVGEVAVKKSDGKGTDIQVGSQAEEKKIVDFTL